MTELTKEFLDIRKKIIERDFARMNNMQMKAVTTASGPILILAGAGSGKTTVLVNRISNLVKYGDAYNSIETPEVTEELLNFARQALEDSSIDTGFLGVNKAKPWEILAITFTNKAANELKERIEAMLGEDAKYIKAGTFHSICAKILRKYGDRLGYTSHFTIYDTDDQKKIIKDVMKKCDISEKQIQPKTILNEISRAKDRLLSPEEYLEDAGIDQRLKIIAKAYSKYQAELKTANAMDFDDLIYNTVALFRECPDILSKYQDSLKHIMVDEYQDTNYAQYILVKLLADKHKNICVVGDDDQSIYRFRGATIENILNFEKHYPDAKVIRLEQNYRSTQNILDAANAVISNNTARKGKNLWTAKGGGEQIRVVSTDDENAEARYVADEMLKHIRNGGKFSDIAILYRMNTQSRAFENTLVRSGIPYKIIGGLRFYDRMEIKDVIAYLNVINNISDNIRLKRIIHTPKRGIGNTTISNAEDIASGLGLSLFEVFENAENYPALSRAAQKLKDFCAIIRDLQGEIETLSLSQLLEKVIEDTGYNSYLETMPEDEKQERKENVGELLTTVIQYELENENPTLSGFLEDVSLISDIDSYNSDSDSAVLMTLHSAKGLEFNIVFIVGMEEGIFPGNQTIYGGNEDMEEERRLAYVGITRAKKVLYITSAFRRMIFGQTNYNHLSRFANEIPSFLCEQVNKQSRGNEIFASARGFGASSYSRPKFTPPAPKQETPKVNFKIGDSVRHAAFGDGIIINSVPMGNDILLEINFESVGSKKLMAAFAKLEKI